MAQIELPNGNYWGVYCVGATEIEVRSKIADLWAKETAKIMINPWRNLDMESGDVSGLVGKQHHLAGKVWLIHKVTREKVRVEPEIAEDRLATGHWERGGPRSK